MVFPAHVYCSTACETAWAQWKRQLQVLLVLQPGDRLDVDVDKNLGEWVQFTRSPNTLWRRFLRYTSGQSGERSAVALQLEVNKLLRWLRGALTMMHADVPSCLELRRDIVVHLGMWHAGLTTLHSTYMENGTVQSILHSAQQSVRHMTSLMHSKPSIPLVDASTEQTEEV